MFQIEVNVTMQLRYLEISKLVNEGISK